MIDGSVRIILDAVGCESFQRKGAKGAKRHRGANEARPSSYFNTFASFAPLRWKLKFFASFAPMR